jgi:AcrR family transcriptional regulator
MSRTNGLPTTKATRQLLVSVARELFTERGYAATSVEDIVQRAGVAKGTLYHHFTGKDVLFRAVYDAVQADVASRLATAAPALDEPWGGVRAGLSAYLDVCLEPAFRRIVVLDGAGVRQGDIGAAAGEHAGAALLRAMLKPVLNRHFPELAEDALVEVTLGGLNGVAVSIARSPDPIRARRDADAVIDTLIRGLRSRVDPSP